jgi:hypothetical protein
MRLGVIGVYQLTITGVLNIILAVLLRRCCDTNNEHQDHDHPEENPDNSLTKNAA